MCEEVGQITVSEVTLLGLPMLDLEKHSSVCEKGMASCDALRKGGALLWNTFVIGPILVLLQRRSLGANVAA